MFAGIEQIDWASMEHAYGNAEEVPGLLRGLASAHPEDRDVALDGMYGTVHHQGDVYDSTLACIPFLFELVADRAVADRGAIIELLVSVGGGEAALEDDDDSDDEDGDEDEKDEGLSHDSDDSDDSDDGYDLDEEEEWEANYRMAETAVRAGVEVFADLVADPDPGVRAAVPVALVLFHGDPAAVLGLVRERLAAESVRPVRIALVEALGLLMRRVPGLAAETGELLVGFASAPQEPAIRLAALGCIAKGAPERLPADVVSEVGELLRQRLAEPRTAAYEEPERPHTDTLISHMRQLKPDDDEGDDLLRALHDGLGDRVGERTRLLAEQLRSPSSAERCNAIWMSPGLFRRYRGDYDEAVALIGDQVGSPEPRLRGAAASILGELFELAAPAADALAAAVAADPDALVQQWSGGQTGLGGPLLALVRCGDPRAVPWLAELLQRPVVPRGIGGDLSYLGEAARPLGPLLRGAVSRVRPGDEDADRLVHGLSALGESSAVPELARLLREADPAADRWFVQALIRAVRTFGPEASEAAPELRKLLAGEFAVAAAESLWAVTGDTDAALPVLLAPLGSDDPHERRGAAEALGTLGPAAAQAAGRLRTMLGSDQLWERTDAAVALGRVAGDAEAVLPVLADAWRTNAYTRTAVARCLGEMGPAAKDSAGLLREELSAPLRHTAQTGGHGSNDIPNDLALLRSCREALGRIEG